MPLWDLREAIIPVQSSGPARRPVHDAAIVDGNDLPSPLCYNIAREAHVKITRKFISISLLAVIGVGLVLYWNEHRTERLSDVVNPLYWIRRMQGKDLYDPATGILYHGNRSLKEIALTIDDGPHAQTGEALLDIFKRYGVHVTFFVVGQRMDEHPELVRRMLAEGHEVGNHSMNHYRLDTLPPERVWREVNDNDINFWRITHRHFTLLRPPGVRYNQTVIGVARQLGYVIVSWSDAAKDFLDVTPDFVVNRVLRRAENGSIILLHDDRPSTVVAMPRIIAALKREGYRFVTISEMLSHLPQPVVIQTDANPPALLKSASREPIPEVHP